MSDVRIIGDRVTYVGAGKAMRQAVQRAVALGDDLSRADLLVLGAVLCATVSYSKITDHVEQRQLVAGSGVSSRHVRRSLGRLAELGVIVWVPGCGRGILTVVGIPPAGEKADSYQSSLGLPPLSAFHESKSGQDHGEKSGQPTRAREEPRSTEKRKAEAKTLIEGEVGPLLVVGPESLPSRLMSDDETLVAVNRAQEELRQELQHAEARDRWRIERAIRDLELTGDGSTHARVMDETAG